MANLRIKGSYIMDTARNMLYNDLDFENAIQLLMNSLQNDEMTENEIRNLAIQILNGEVEIYDTDTSYDVRYLEQKDPRYDFYGIFHKLLVNQRELEYKFESIVDIIYAVALNAPIYVIEGLNQDFYNKFKEKLWDNYPRSYGQLGYITENDYDEFYGQVGSPRWKQRMVDIFNVRNGLPVKVDASQLSPTVTHAEAKRTLKPNKKLHSSDFVSERETEYGFIDLEGKFIPVSFGEHELFAQAFTEENFKSDYDRIKKAHSSNYRRLSQTFCDFLVEKKGYVLLDNQAGGHAFITRDKSRNLTKRQVETLYDYLMQHDRHKEASLLYDESSVSTI